MCSSQQISSGQRSEGASSRNLQEVPGRQVSQATEEVQATEEGRAAGARALRQRGGLNKQQNNFRIKFTTNCI